MKPEPQETQTGSRGSHSEIDACNTKIQGAPTTQDIMKLLLWKSFIQGGIFHVFLRQHKVQSDDLR